jgi:tetratricopeptide (TPR) repeat protein
MKNLFPILTLFLCAAMVQASSKNDKPEDPNPHSVAMSGRTLTAQQVAEMEAAIAQHPDDLTARTKLLGYYFMSRHTGAAAKEGRKHVLWIIKNRPEAEIAGTPFCMIDAITDTDGYHEAKQLWLDQTKAHPKDSAIVGHAARFLSIHDRDTAKDLLKQAQSLEPKNPEWSDQLGHWYSRGGDKEGAAKALAEFERAQANDTSDLSKFSRLDYLAKSAFDAQEFEKASQYAEALLKTGEDNSKNWNFGNAVNHGNIILGRIALKKGDTKKADEYLLKAGQTPGSPQLDSFGPNMSLAKELLEAGEKETVLQYFQLCRKFWKTGDTRLDDWTKEVKAGQVPEFGANLVY